MTPHDNARIRVYLTNAIEMLQKCLEPLDPYAELKAALKAGKTIQMSDADGNWKDFKRATPDWSAPLHAYRIKPWTLPDPPPGQAWHRTDWTQDMLPEGWRPMLLGEDGEGEYLSWDNKWRPLAHNDGPAKAESAHSRTRRPLPPVAPAEPRVVPPAVVPWDCPEDVPGPVCWIRSDELSLEAMVVTISSTGFEVHSGSQLRFVTWKHFATIHEKHGYKHSTDRRTWLPCTKPSGVPAERE